MNFEVKEIIENIKKPFLYIDYNEMLDDETIMLSKTDIKNDYLGNPIELCQGLEIVGYQEDESIEGERDDIIAEGICVLNDTGTWAHVKWLLKVNEKGIRYTSDIVKNHD